MSNLYPWQAEIWQQLVGLKSRLPHALMLRGPRGIGKLELALQFSRAMLCNEPLASGEACGQCTSCHWFAQESHPDFRLLQPAALAGQEEREGGKKASSEITIDAIRSLEDFANLSSHCGGYRLVVIHPAEALNNNAANALLKTLEEPGTNLLFILVTHKPQQLLPTIVSRCLSVSIPIPPADVAADWLLAQGVANAGLRLAEAGFAPLFAQSLSEEAVAGNNQILLGALRQAGRFDALALADQLQKVPPEQIIHLLQQWVYDLLSYRLAKQVRYFSELTESIATISRSVDLEKLLQFHKDLSSARRVADHPLNPKLLLESLFLAYAATLSARAKGKEHVY